MPDYSPSFLFFSDAQGRYPSALRPSGGTINVVTSGSPNGGYIPGDRLALLTRPTMLRVAATVNSRIRFTAEAGTVDSTDMLFQAGTEAVALPTGTNYINAITDDGSAGKLSVTVLQ